MTEQQPNEAKFEVKVVATGEVRDKDGNLISTPTAEGTQTMTADQLREAGLPVPPHPDEGK